MRQYLCFTVADLALAIQPDQVTEVVAVPPIGIGTWETDATQVHRSTP